MTSVEEPKTRDAPTRGKWSSSIDFLTANIGYTLGLKNFQIWASILPFMSGTSFLIPYLFGLIIFSIPIFFIQSFIGQFSSSGSITAYRIAPLFKGIGYVFLVLNLCSVSYYTVLTGTSLYYLVNSVKQIPCNNDLSIANCSPNDVFYNWDDTHMYCHSAFSWRSCQLQSYTSVTDARASWLIVTDARASWLIVYLTLIVWILIGGIVINGVQTIGKIMRYLTIITIIIFMLIFIRFAFLPGTWKGVIKFLIPEWEKIQQNLSVWTIIGPWKASLLTFGAGLGTTLTLASYNNFQTNIGKFTILANLMHMLLFIMTGLITDVAYEYIRDKFNYSLFSNGIDRISISNTFLYVFNDIFGKWSMLFFLMIFIGDLLSCVVHVFTILTALFDEFVTLRYYKKQFTVISLIVMYFSSLIYTYYETFYLDDLLNNSVTIIQILICCIELVTVLWVYGPSRFQRDVKFMIGKKIPTSLIHIIRILVPICILSIYIYTLRVSSRLYLGFSYTTVILVTSMKILFILIIPIYMFYKLLRSSGNFRQRVIYQCKADNWLPKNADDQTKYSEFIDNNLTFERI